MDEINNDEKPQELVMTSSESERMPASEIANTVSQETVAISPTTEPVTTALVDIIALTSQSVQVFAPAAGPSRTPAELDDSFFEPTLSDVQAYHSTVAGRSKRLNEAPLLTSKHRDAEREARERRKADKWPETTIRIKFSDGMQIQSIFPSTSPIQPVYAFIRSALRPDAADKPFTLYQPPRTTFPERPLPPPVGAKRPKPHINPAMKAHIIAPANYGQVRGEAAAGMLGGSGGSESLNDLGLVPQSVLLVRWDDPEMNASDSPAPLTNELRAKVVPLPPPVAKEPVRAVEATKKQIDKSGSSGDMKMPKWMQKGLLKKK